MQTREFQANVPFRIENTVTIFIVTNPLQMLMFLIWKERERTLKNSDSLVVDKKILELL